MHHTDPSNSTQASRARLRSMLAIVAGFSLVVASALSLWPRLPPGGSADVPGYSFATAPSISSWNDRRLARRHGESDLALATRLTQVVYQSMYHCEYKSTPRLIDKLVSVVLRQTFDQVGFLTPSALVCGYCHQASYILARALENSGVDAQVFGLNGHVVTLINIDGARWIGDPDYGLDIFRYDESTWNSVSAAYFERIGNNPSWADAIKGSYSTRDDDGPYYSMDWLGKIEHEQYFYLELFKWSTFILIALGILLTARGLLGFQRAHSKQVARRS